MKKWLSSKSNILTLLIVAFVIWRQAPLFLSNFEASGVKLVPKSYAVINPGPEMAQIQYPPAKNSVTIFWATWCGPCKVEMDRLQSSVAGGKIPKEQIFAINPFESPAIVRKFLKESKFDFTFIDAPAIVEQLKIQVTPTTLLMKGDSISSMSSGMSIIGIWKAEWMIN